jgi:hypothetical protein
MIVRGDACDCVHRFLSVLRYKPYQTQYEDELCQARRVNNAIVAIAYEISNGAKYRIGECVMSLW